MRRSNIAFAVAALSGSASAWVSNIDINNPPYKADPGSYGYNQCGTKASPDSKCQNIYLRSADDFCMFGPHDLSGVSETEREAVSYCTKDGHGTRLIPPGTFESVHFVHTEHYVQITGRGNFTNINVLAGDDGGELDAAGYDARGNPIGGVVFGKDNQFEHWTEFLLPDEFCIRACFKGPDDWRYCNHIYDIMACRWNVPGDYTPGFDDCEGEDVPHPMGEYLQPDGKIKIWKQGDKPIPPPGAPGKLKSCKRASPPGSLYNGASTPNVTAPNATVPDQNSTLPGQNSTVPGQNSTMPGQNSTMPGQNSTMPGQNATEPGSNSSSSSPPSSSNPFQGSGSQDPTLRDFNSSSSSNSPYPSEGSGPDSSTSSGSNNTAGNDLPGSSGQDMIPSDNQSQSTPGSPYPTEGAGSSSSSPTSPSDTEPNGSQTDFNHGTVSSIVRTGSASVSSGLPKEMMIPGLDQTVSSLMNGLQNNDPYKSASGSESWVDSPEQSSGGTPQSQQPSETSAQGNGGSNKGDNESEDEGEDEDEQEGCLP